MSLTRGVRVRIEIPRARPSCLVVAPFAADIREGVYLGIPRFETTLAQVRMPDGGIRRFPLEYLSPLPERQAAP